MGAYLRTVYARAELLPGTGCPAVNAVQVWADGSSDRTRRSGQILADALAPDCGLVARHGPAGAPDPVFDSGRVCLLDPAEALAAVQARTAVGTAVTDKAADKAIAALKRILGPGACAAVQAACLDGPSTLEAGPAAPTVAGPRIAGPLGLAAAVAENLLLAYAEGLPADQVAWGQGSPETLAVLAAARRRAADLLRRTPLVATFRAATLLRMLADLLQGEAPRGLGVPRLGARAPRGAGRAGHHPVEPVRRPRSRLVAAGTAGPHRARRHPRLRGLAQPGDRRADDPRADLRPDPRAAALRPGPRPPRPAGLAAPLAIGICRARDGACGLETFAANLRAALPPVCIR